jgi:hypothetical protein
MIRKTFSENKWYVNALFVLGFLYFLWGAAGGISGLLSIPVDSSPLIPHYANYFVAITEGVIIVTDLLGIFWIIFLYQKKTAGWIFVLAAATSKISLLGYYMILQREFLFDHKHGLFLLLFIYLLLNSVRQSFNLKPIHYLFPVGISIIFIMMVSEAFSLSMIIDELVR